MDHPGPYVMPHHAHELRGAHRDILRLILAALATSDHRTPARQAGSASTAVSSHMSCTKRVPRVPFNRGKYCVVCGALNAAVPLQRIPHPSTRLSSSIWRIIPQTSALSACAALLLMLHMSHAHPNPVAVHQTCISSLTTLYPYQGTSCCQAHYTFCSHSFVLPHRHLR